MNTFSFHNHTERPRKYVPLSEFSPAAARRYRAAKSLADSALQLPECPEHPYALPKYRSSFRIPGGVVHENEPLAEETVEPILDYGTELEER